jgi:hypothetical protein
MLGREKILHASRAVRQHDEPGARLQQRRRRVPRVIANPPTTRMAATRSRLRQCPARKTAGGLPEPIPTDSARKADALPLAPIPCQSAIKHYRDTKAQSLSNSICLPRRPLRQQSSAPAGVGSLLPARRRSYRNAARGRDFRRRPGRPGCLCAA